MATQRTTFTLDEVLLDQARQLNINVSAAARAGVARAVCEAAEGADRAAYLAHPEVVDEDWVAAEAWGDE